MGYSIVKPAEIRETLVTADLDNLGIYSFSEIKEMEEIPDDRRESPSPNRSLLVDFSTPPEELVGLVEDVLEAGESEDIKASQLASASIDALKNWNETVSTDHFLASKVYDEVFYEEEGIAAITDIPNYFYGPLDPPEFLFTDVDTGDGYRSRTGIFSQDETSVAWQVGSIVSDYDVPSNFVRTYNETIGNYDLQRSL